MKSTGDILTKFGTEDCWVHRFLSTVLGLSELHSYVIYSLFAVLSKYLALLCHLVSAHFKEKYFSYLYQNCYTRLLGQ